MNKKYAIVMYGLLSFTPMLQAEVVEMLKTFKQMPDQAFQQKLSKLSKQDQHEYERLCRNIAEAQEALQAFELYTGLAYIDITQEEGHFEYWRPGQRPYADK